MNKETQALLLKILKIIGGQNPTDDLLPFLQQKKVWPGSTQKRLIAIGSIHTHLVRDVLSISSTTRANKLMLSYGIHYKEVRCPVDAFHNTSPKLLCYYVKDLPKFLEMLSSLEEQVNG